MIVKDLAYRKSILAELFLTERSTCLDLSISIGKSQSLVNKVLSELIEDDLIVECGLAPSSGGRRPLTYSLKADSFYIIGIAMDQFVSRIVIIDALKEFVIQPFEMKLPLAGNQGALGFLAEKINDIILESTIEKDKILGIGIGMPGFIDSNKGNNHTFLGADICIYIESMTGLPTFIENDSSVIALAEYKFGMARAQDNAMVINLSWGIGLGMIINSKLFRGDEGFAGEFSHIPLFKNGQLCGCGKTGCLETETSLTYMLGKAREEILAGRASLLKSSLPNDDNNELQVRLFLQAAIMGDSLAVKIISDAGYNIGRGIAILMYILNPGKIILSGRGAAAGKMWLAPIQRAINEFCIPRLIGRTVVEVSALGYEAEILGAVTLVIENIKYCTSIKIK